MKWILCVQTPWNSVKYITDDLNDYSSHSYPKFMEMIMQLLPYDPNGLRDAIDSFHTVFLDIESKRWYIENYIPEKENYTDKEMYELNPSKEILEEQEKNKSILSRTKKFIDSFNKERVEQNMNKFNINKGKNNGRTTKGY